MCQKYDKDQCKTTSYDWQTIIIFIYLKALNKNRYDVGIDDDVATIVDAF